MLLTFVTTSWEHKCLPFLTSWSATKLDQSEPNR